MNIYKLLTKPKVFNRIFGISPELFKQLTIELESNHFMFNQEYLKTKVGKMMHSESLLTDKSIPHVNPHRDKRCQGIKGG